MANDAREQVKDSFAGFRKLEEGCLFKMTWFGAWGVFVCFCPLPPNKVGSMSQWATNQEGPAGEVQTAAQSWSCGSCGAHVTSCLGEGCPFSSSCPTYANSPQKRLGLKWSKKAKERRLYSSFLVFPCGRTPSNTPEVSKAFTLPLEERKGELTN